MNDIAAFLKEQRAQMSAHEIAIGLGAYEPDVTKVVKSLYNMGEVERFKVGKEWKYAVPPLEPFHAPKKKRTRKAKVTA